MTFHIVLNIGRGPYVLVRTDREATKWSPAITTDLGGFKTLAEATRAQRIAELAVTR